MENETIMKKDEVVEYVKNERKRKGLSLRALGELSGLRAATICEFENKGSGTLKTFLALVDGLGLELEVKKKHKV